MVGGWLGKPIQNRPNIGFPSKAERVEQEEEVGRKELHFAKFCLAGSVRCQVAEGSKQYAGIVQIQGVGAKSGPRKQISETAGDFSQKKLLSFLLSFLPKNRRKPD